MKKIINTIALLGLVWLTACYEDKGNYDYRELTQVEISGIKDNYTVYVDETFNIPVEVSYKNGTLKDVSYEWRINGKVIYTGKDLNVVVDFPVKPGLYADFSVIDNETGLKTMKKFTVNVSTPYYNGWLILSDEGDHSVLSYLRNDGTLFGDIYQELNGEQLNGGASTIKEHWTPWGEGTGEVFVGITKGPNYSVDLDGNSLKRVVYNKDEFLGGTPENFFPQNMDCVSNWDYMISNGKLYTRYIDRSTDAQYHEGLYVNGAVPGDYSLLPMTMRGNIIMSNDIIAFDMVSKSYKLLRGGQMSNFNYVNDPTKAFIPYNMGKTLLSGGATSTESPRDYFITFLKGDDGQYYVQRFYFSGWGAKSYYSISETVFPKPELIMPDTKWAVCIGRPYVYFTSGNKLYSYNYDDKGNAVVKELKGTKFAGKIKEIALCLTDYQKLAVISENPSQPGKNDFILLDVSVIGDGAIIEGSSKEAVFGNVVDLVYKLGSQWDTY